VNSRKMYAPERRHMVMPVFVHVRECVCTSAAMFVHVEKARVLSPTPHTPSNTTVLASMAELARLTSDAPTDARRPCPRCMRDRYRLRSRSM